MKSTIAVFASARRHGNTGKLMDSVAQALNIEVIDLSQKTISPYDYEANNLEDDFIPTFKTLLEYEQIIFASPVYWYAVSAQMKVFIDRISDVLNIETLKPLGRELRGKNAFILSSSINPAPDSAFLGAFTNTCGYLGMHYKGNLHANCKAGFQADSYKNATNTFIELVKQLD